MEQTALVLMIVTLLLLVVIVGLLTVLIYKLFKQPPPASAPVEAPKKEYHPAIVERMNEVKHLRPRKTELFCPNHPDEPGETQCAICDRIFCKSCIKPFQSLYLCKEHLPLIMSYEWDEALTIKTSTHDPEQGVRLYEAKKEIFETEGIPTYVITHYKINVDQDYIETYLVVYGRNSEVQTVRSQFEPHLSNMITEKWS